MNSPTLRFLAIATALSTTLAFFPAVGHAALKIGGDVGKFWERTGKPVVRGTIKVAGGGAVYLIGSLGMHPGSNENDSGGSVEEGSSEIDKSQAAEKPKSEKAKERYGDTDKEKLAKKAGVMAGRMVVGALIGGTAGKVIAGGPVGAAAGAAMTPSETACYEGEQCAPKGKILPSPVTKIRK